MHIEHTQQMQTIRWLHVGFVFTGVGTTLFACVLPTLSTMWHMNDERAGILFAAQFSGSALGALLVGTNFFNSVVRGYLLLIASAVSLAFFPHFSQVLRFLVFGLGLGLTMTATSMLIGTIYAGRRGRALSFLNGFWTIGAALCPEIASLWVRRWPPTYLFLALAVSMSIVFIVVTHPVAAFAGPAAMVDEVQAEYVHTEYKDWHLILVFAALGALYVGVETSISGWLMTYVHRLPLVSRLWAPVATSFFWIALLCGRMLAPAVLLRVSEARLLKTSLAIALMSTILLLLSHSPITITLTVAAAGLVLGPIFPLCLAKALASLDDSPKAKWVFSISGLGGAILPWITGIVSAHEGSLRAGLLVPVFALGAMMLLNRLESAGRWRTIA
jgi:MFS transporter, FHS family, glucose/mannose:H+ symporter